METGTFPTEDVSEFIKTNFVPLKYESSRDSEQFMRFGIRGVPAYIFLDAKGNEIHRIVGYYKAEDFLKELHQARSLTAEH
jgi:thioredoxin-related protein